MTHSYLYQSDDIGVKPLSLEELDTGYVSWFLDAEVCQFNSHFAFPQSRDSCEQFIRSLNGDRSRVVWAVYHKETSTHIGNLSLQAINWVNRSAEIAFFFGHKAFWGRGYAFQASQFILHHAFSVLNLHRIHCGTASTNKGMLKLAEKLGMKEEGCREESLFLNGEFFDTIEFGLLREVYIKRQNPM